MFAPVDIACLSGHARHGTMRRPPVQLTKPQFFSRVLMRIESEPPSAHNGVLPW